MTDTRHDPPAVVETHPVMRVMVWAGFPLLGAFAALLVKWLGGWALKLPWVPFKGPLTLIASLPEPGVTFGALAVGAVAGLVLAYLAHQDSLVVTVAPDTVTLRRGERSRELAGSSVAGAFAEGGHLVLLGHDNRELAREVSDLDRDGLRAAFTDHGYGWHDTDPHGDAFVPWVEESPDLPDSAHRLLKARRRALEKGRKDDAEDLREELGRLGVVVRVERKRQQWRRVAD